MAFDIIYSFKEVNRTSKFVWLSSSIWYQLLDKYLLLVKVVICDWQCNEEIVCYTEGGDKVNEEVLI